jgi:hypothetical protein
VFFRGLLKQALATTQPVSDLIGLPLRQSRRRMGGQVPRCGDEDVYPGRCPTQKPILICPSTARAAMQASCSCALLREMEDDGVGGPAIDGNVEDQP